MTAAEDNEVIGIRDDLRPERFTASGEPPILQEPVHVQVGQQRTDDTALRRAAPAPFASSQAPFSVSIPFLNRRLKPQLDEPQHVAVDDAARHTTQQLRMWDRVEVLRQIGVHDVGVAPAEKPVHFLDRVARPASGTIAVGTILEVRLEDRFENELGGSLDYPIPDRWNAERSFSSLRLWYHHPPHRHRPIRPRDQFLTQARQPPSRPDASMWSNVLPSVPGAPALVRATRKP